MTDHEPNAALREQLRLEKTLNVQRIEDAKAKAFTRWRLYLKQREREKAERKKKSA